MLYVHIMHHIISYHIISYHIISYHMRRSDFISQVLVLVGACLSYIASSESDFDFDINKAEKKLHNYTCYVSELRYQFESGCK